MKAQRNVVSMLVAGAVLAVAVAFAPAAHAEGVSVKEYRKAMGGLISDVAAWNAELDVQLAALQTKPELACGAEYGELVRRGGWLADDLIGTAKNAPQVLVGLGVAAGEGLNVTVDGAGTASLDCDGTHIADAIAQVEAGRDQYDENIARVRVFTIGKGR
jgi:hypothetical protein